MSESGLAVILLERASRVPRSPALYSISLAGATVLYRPPSS